MHFVTAICNRVGVKHFSKYLSQVQVLFHICKYKFKYSEFLGDINYFFNQVQVKYKYFGNKQQHFPLPADGLCYQSQNIIILGVVLTEILQATFSNTF